MAYLASIANNFEKAPGNTWEGKDLIRLGALEKLLYSIAMMSADVIFNKLTKI